MIEFCKNYRPMFPRGGPIQTVVIVPSRCASELQVRLWTLAQQFKVSNLCISFSKDGYMHLQGILADKESRNSFCKEVNSLLTDELGILSEISLTDLLDESQKLFEEILPIYKLLYDQCKSIEDISNALANKTLSKEQQKALKTMAELLFARKTTSVKAEF